MKNTHDPAADRVLEQTLHELRRTRNCRLTRRAALCTTALAVLVFTALFRSDPASAPVPLPQVASIIPDAAPPEKDKLVALVWRDGSPTLEELAPDELGYPFYPYVPFSLEPVITYSDFGQDTF